MQSISSSIGLFAAHVLGKPLYPYQLEIAEAVLRSIREGRGAIFTVMMSRQSGKNQLSAVLEAYLLYTRGVGTIVKAAPTFTPQILNSRLRLLSLLDTPLTRSRIWSSQGYIVGLAPSADPALVQARSGPRITFYSASPTSNVVGATADLLLEIDEAQDVDPEKFDRDFRPMASTTNATTILYGTAWTDTTLLAKQRAANLLYEQQGGERRHFQFNWQTLAAINPAYRTFVKQEIARLGQEHQSIQTQYYLRTLDGAGYLLTTLQQRLLRGSHAWEEEPEPGVCYLAGLDVAGDERLSKGSVDRRGRDSSVLSIGRVQYNECDLPMIEVVHQQSWTGSSYLDQYTAVSMLMRTWNIRQLVIDATGQGAGLSSMLVEALGAERVQPFVFSRPSKSRLVHQLLAFINSGRLTLYDEEKAPARIVQECWEQLRKARYRLLPSEQLDAYVDPSEGHDDFLTSLVLLTEGLDRISGPASSAIIHARPWEYDGSRF